MKILLYTAILIAVLILPEKGTDVGKLIPVEVIAVSEEAGIVTIETDTGDLGQGSTLEEALADLRDTAPGVIYLDTAEYLILEEGTAYKQVLQQYLKGDTKVCYATHRIPLEGVADYLSVHKPKERLDQNLNSGQGSVLAEENGRFHLNKK